MIEKNEIEKVQQDLEFQPTKAKFNTKIVSEMKHNGEIVEVLEFSKGKDIYNDRYTVRFNDGTTSNNIMSVELDFDYKRDKINSINHKNKER